MHLTVAICTRNRARPLATALESLCSLRIPNGISWDVLVIDNDSTDGTADVIASFVGRLPISRHFEPKKGVSNARNRAVDEAAGDYILWTDDDVAVDPDWLAAYSRAISRHSSVDVLGGAVTPIFQGGPPAWLARALKYSKVGNVFCSVDPRGRPLKFDRHSQDVPWGSNYAVRRSAYRTHRYNPNLGPGSAVAPLCDETDLIERILASGGTGIWVADARVKHIIPKERQTVQYLRKYYTACGLTLSFRNSLEDSRGQSGKTNTWFGIDRWLWRSLVEDEIAYWFKRLFAPPEVWCMQLRQLGYHRGALLGELRRRRSRSD
jgi:glycosyltransferase involved in cell wall biosynthesis